MDICSDYYSEDIIQRDKYDAILMSLEVALSGDYCVEDCSEYLFLRNEYNNTEMNVKVNMSENSYSEDNLQRNE